MKIGIVDNFDAAHYLPGYKGKCANIHGHTYTVEAIFEGTIDDNTGFVMDFHDLKRRLKTIINNLDHTNINDLLPNPTAERITEYMWNHLKSDMEDSNVRLISLKLWEGKNKWVMRD
jgi:6-pyruvoyltetrahydropterin/6-carboxytetrahydropterin synthase